MDGPGTICGTLVAVIKVNGRSCWSDVNDFGRSILRDIAGTLTSVRAGRGVLGAAIGSLSRVTLDPSCNDDEVILYTLLSVAALGREGEWRTVSSDTKPPMSKSRRKSKEPAPALPRSPL